MKGILQRKETPTAVLQSGEGRVTNSFVTGKGKKMTVNKEMTIAEIIRLDAGIIPILLGSGMHCIGCPSAQGESLEEACMVHGIEVDALVDAINEHLSANA